MGWASRDPAVLTKLESGYPRFYVPHLVRRLEDSVIKWIDSRPQSVLGDSQQKTKFAGLAVKLFPNQTMANACRAYLQKRRHNNDEAHHIRLVAVEAHGGLTTIQCGYPEQTASPKIIVYTMIYPNALEAEAKAFWQHTGYGISSRFAQLWLDHAPFLNDTHASSMEDIFRLPILQAKEAALKIRSRIAASYTGSDNKVQQDDIFLYQTGMTAIAQTALMLQSHIQSETRWKLRVAVFGFV